MKHPDPTFVVEGADFPADDPNIWYEDENGVRQSFKIQIPITFE